MDWVKHVRVLVVLLQILFATSIVLAQSQATTQLRPTQLVFLATPKPGGILYTINGTDIGPDPLRGLGRTVERYGNDAPIDVVVDNRLPISTVGEAVALAGKAGFKHVTSFGVDRESGKAFEIRFGPWVAEPK